MASCSLGKVEESRIVWTSVVTSERETEEPQFNSRCGACGCLGIEKRDALKWEVNKSDSELKCREVFAFFDIQVAQS
jgi:hypothetical protein